MSLLGTLAKVAVGVAIAKGVTTLSQNRTAQRPGGSAGTGNPFGEKNSPGADGLGDLMDMLGGSKGASGGLGSMLEGLSKASRPSSGGAIASTPPTSGSLGDLLNQSLDNFGEPVSQPEPEHEDAARVLLRAMLQAAKSDGRIDANEKEALMSKLGDISQDEMAFINDELAAPVDIDGLARDVPDGMENQVYMMSLVAIDLDQKAEAEYLHNLAQALSIDPRESNAIHEQMGEPKLYS